MRIIDNDKMILTIIVMIMRFYMVTGEKGWLPYGTDCSGEAKREAYCVKVNVTTLAFANKVLTFWQNSVGSLSGVRQRWDPVVRCGAWGRFRRPGRPFPL